MDSNTQLTLQQSSSANQSLQPSLPKPNDVSLKIVLIVISCFVVTILALIVVIIVVIINKNNTPGNNSNNNATIVAGESSVELAKEVCKKYGGEILKNRQETRFGGVLNSTDGFSDYILCERYTQYEVDPAMHRGSAYWADGTPMTDQEIQDAYGVAILPTDFLYEIGFLGDDKKDGYRNDLRNQIVNSEAREDISKYTILEDSADMIKACVNMAGFMSACIGMHGNAVVGVSGGDYSTIDKIFANLGFPDRNRLEDYAQAKSNTGGS